MKNKRIYLSPPHLGEHERQFVAEAFESNYIAPLGPQVDAFEKEFSEYTGIKHCLAVSSGTAAMHLALAVLGIKPEDTVMASTLTFMGSVSPVTFMGADLVFIDSDKNSWNMDPNLLLQALEKMSKAGMLPKAVIPTDLYGQCADYEKIYQICNAYDIPVVVDSAEAMGALYSGNSPDDPLYPHPVHAGKGAKAAIFSFNGNKIITTSGGGMLASDDKDFIDVARHLSQQAKDPLPYYEHSRIGFNYRMSNILAGIGRGQLKALDARVRQKRKICRHYQEAFKNVSGIELMPEADYGISNRWLTVITIDEQQFGASNTMVLLALEQENIESRHVWKPMHLQPVFLPTGAPPGCDFHYGSEVIGGRVSETLFEKGLCLPSGTAMSEQDVNRIADIIKQTPK